MRRKEGNEGQPSSGQGDPRQRRIDALETELAVGQSLDRTKRIAIVKEISKLKEEIASGAAPKTQAPQSSSSASSQKVEPEKEVVTQEAQASPPKDLENSSMGPEMIKELSLLKDQIRGEFHDVLAKFVKLTQPVGQVSSSSSEKTGNFSKPAVEVSEMKNSPGVKVEKNEEKGGSLEDLKAEIEKRRTRFEDLSSELAKNDSTMEKSQRIKLVKEITALRGEIAALEAQLPPPEEPEPEVIAPPPTREESARQRVAELEDILSNVSGLEKSKARALQGELAKLKEELEGKRAAPGAPPVTLKEKIRRIDDIEETLAAVQNMEKQKRIAMVKELIRLKGEVEAEQSQGPPSSDPQGQDDQVGEAEAGEAEGDPQDSEPQAPRLVLSPQEIKEKQNKIQDIEDLFTSGIKVDREKKKRLTEQLKKLKAELAEAAGGPVASSSHAPQTGQNSESALRARIEEINDTLNDNPRMEKAKRIALTKEVIRLQEEVAALASGPPGGSEVPESDPSGPPEADPSGPPPPPARVPLTKKEIREKEGRVEDIESLLNGGTKLDKEKKLKLQKELRALQELLQAEKEPAPAPPAPTASVSTPSGPDHEAQASEKLRQAEDLSQLLKASPNLSKGKKAALQADIDRLRAEAAELRTKAPEVSESPQPAEVEDPGQQEVIEEQIPEEEPTDPHDIYAFVYDYTAKQRRIEEITRLLAETRTSRSERVKLVGELRELQREVYLCEKRQLVEQVISQQDRIAQIFALLNGSEPMEAEQRLALVEELAELQEAVFLGRDQPESTTPPPEAVEEEPEEEEPAEEPGLSIEEKRTRVAEINNLIENGPPISKNERNKLVEERNQLQAEISNPQLAVSKKKPAPKKVQKSADPSAEISALRAQLSAINDLLKSNPTLNKAKKAGLQREAEELQAKIDALGPGTGSAPPGPAASAPAEAQPQGDMTPEQKRERIRQINDEIENTPTMPKHKRSALAEERNQLQAELSNPQLAAQRLQKAAEAAKASVGEAAPDTQKLPALQKQLADINDLLKNNPGINKAKKTQLLREAETLQAQIDSMKGNAPQAQKGASEAKIDNPPSSSFGPVEDEFSTPEAKRARIQAINQQIEDNQAMSKNERNKLVEERTQLQAELSNPQLAAQRLEKAKQAKGGQDPSSSSSALSGPQNLAKIAELQTKLAGIVDLIKNNPTLNKAKKAGLQREADTLQAEIDSMKAGGAQASAPSAPQASSSMAKEPEPVSSQPEGSNLSTPEAKRARIQAINQQIEDNQAMSKNERNKLVEERTQLQAELSNPQLAAQRLEKTESPPAPKNSQPPAADSSKLAELKAKLNDVNDLLKNNPTINKAKKAGLQREADGLQAQIDALLSGGGDASVGSTPKQVESTPSETPKEEKSDLSTPEAKRARIQAINQQIEDNQAMSKNERNKLVEERTQLQAELSNPQLAAQRPEQPPKKSIDQPIDQTIDQPPQDSSSAPPAPPASVDLKKIAELEAKIKDTQELIASNPTLNKAKKAGLQREIDSCQAQIDALRSGKSTIDPPKSAPTPPAEVRASEDAPNEPVSSQIRSPSPPVRPPSPPLRPAQAAAPPVENDPTPQPKAAPIDLEKVKGLQAKIAELSELLANNPGLSKAKKIIIQREIDGYNADIKNLQQGNSPASSSSQPKTPEDPPAPKRGMARSPPPTQVSEDTPTSSKRGGMARSPPPTQASEDAPPLPAKKGGMARSPPPTQISEDIPPPAKKGGMARSPPPSQSTEDAAPPAKKGGMARSPPTQRPIEETKPAPPPPPPKKTASAPSGPEAQAKISALEAKIKEINDLIDANPTLGKVKKMGLQKEIASLQAQIDEIQ